MPVILKNNDLAISVKYNNRDTPLKRAEFDYMQIYAKYAGNKILSNNVYKEKTNFIQSFIVHSLASYFYIQVAQLFKEQYSPFLMIVLKS